MDDKEEKTGFENWKWGRRRSREMGRVLKIRGLKYKGHLKQLAGSIISKEKEKERVMG